jgi:hypothetical protein
VRATSACTSTSSGRWPSSTGATTEPGRARAAIREEERRRVGHAVETAIGHLEQAELVDGAEAVLHGAEQPEGVVALTLEREHGVDQVLEHARPGERALLGDVPDQHRAHRALLGEAHQPVGALAHLRHRPGCRTEVGVEHRLDGVDGDHVGLHGLDVGEHVREGGVGHEPQVGWQGTEALRAQPHLLGRLLGRDVEASLARLGRAGQGLQQEGGTCRCPAPRPGR